MSKSLQTTRWFSRTSPFLAVLLILVGMTGCGEDNPAQPDPGEECGHFDADGVVVESEGVAVVSQWEGTIEGELEVEVGESLELTVVFLRPDSSRGVPAEECEDQTLGLAIANENIATAVTTRNDRWEFTLTGVSEGETTLRVRIDHADHADFTSLELPVHVEHHHEVEIEGFELRSGTDVLVSQAEGVLTGDLEVHHEETLGPLTVVFLDHDGHEVTPEEGATLSFTVADELVVSVTPDGTDPFVFSVEGLEEGETTMTFAVLHAGHTDFESLPIPIEVGEHHHEVEIAGFRILSGMDLLVEQTEGTVTGSLTAPEGGALGPLNIVFLDATNEVVEPEEGAALQLVFANEAIASATPEGGDPFAFTLNGLLAGNTTLTFDLQHEGHSDFTSQPIDVEVTAGIAEPEAALVRSERNPLAFWNYDPDRGPDQVHGGIAVELGDSRTGLAVAWLGPYDSGQVNDKRPELNLGDDYEMSWTVANPSIATIAGVGKDGMSFEVTGLGVGTTSVTFELTRDANPVLTAGPFPIEVVDPTGLTIQDHYLNLGGAWTVIVMDGQVASSGCNRDENPGYIDLEVGELSALYKITLLDEGCNKIQLDDNPGLDYEYRFRIGDSEVARIVQTPIHWGEDLVFHVEGLQAGSTDLTVYLMEGDVLQWKSPPYPVQVQ